MFPRAKSKALHRPESSRALLTPVDEVQERDDHKKTQKLRYRPFHAVDPKSCGSNGEEHQNSENRKEWVRAQAHRQIEQLIKAERFAEAKMSIENHQPDK